jgi:N-acetylneuraminate 9-O-acetyltransferase
MNTDYIFYYFSPLVSAWYLIVYATMGIGSRFNDRTLFLVIKICLSMTAVTWFMSEPRLLELAFDILERFCGIRWSAQEWAFRFNLDLWIVYIGMLTALAFIKIREHRMPDHPYWPAAVKIAIGISVLAMLWFFVFELAQPTKFVYNKWHPYISFIPILAFVVLRNATPVLRSTTSRLFAFIGSCSLETFIIQYHYWLAGDTKGILLVLPSTRWRPLNMVITTIAFIYVSHRVSEATGELTTWICGRAKAVLPVVADPPRPSDFGEPLEAIPLTSGHGDQSSKIDAESVAPREPDTPAKPVGRAWAERLAASSTTPSEGWRVHKLGLKSKLALALVSMWVLNIIWPIP